MKENDGNKEAFRHLREMGIGQGNAILTRVMADKLIDGDQDPRLVREFIDQRLIKYIRTSPISKDLVSIKHVLDGSLCLVTSRGLRPGI